MARVVFVAGSLDSVGGGVSAHTLRLAEALVRQGADPVVLTTRAAALTERSLVPLVGAVPTWSLRGLSAVVHALRAAEADLAHVHFAPSGPAAPALRWLPAALALLGWRRPLVTTLHGPDGGFTTDGERPVWAVGERRGWWERESGLLAGWSAAIVVTSEQRRLALARRVPAVATRVHAIPVGPAIRVWPAPLPSRTAALRRQFELPNDAAVVVVCGSYGADEALAGVSRLGAEHRDVHLLAVSTRETPLTNSGRARLVDRARSLGVAERLRVAVGVPEEMASQLLAIATLGVVSLHVPGATAVLGALLTHGLPIVATPSEPSDGRLRDGVSALLVRPGDAAALAAGIVRLLASPALREQLRRGALEAGAAFTWPMIAAAHVELYDSVLQRRPRVPAAGTRAAA